MVRAIPLSAAVFRRSLAPALAVLAATTGVGFASASSSVRLGVPGSVKAGGRVVIHARGSAARSEDLTVVIDTRRCARTLAHEVARPNVLSTTFHVQQGTFRKAAVLSHTAPGIHYACAYLNPKGPGVRTLARASAHFTAH